MTIRAPLTPLIRQTGPTAFLDQECAICYEAIDRSSKVIAHIGINPESQTPDVIHPIHADCWREAQIHSTDPLIRCIACRAILVPLRPVDAIENRKFTLIPRIFDREDRETRAYLIRAIAAPIPEGTNYPKRELEKKLYTIRRLLKLPWDNHDMALRLFAAKSPLVNRLPLDEKKRIIQTVLNHGKTTLAVRHNTAINLAICEPQLAKTMQTKEYFGVLLATALTGVALARMAFADTAKEAGPIFYLADAVFFLGGLMILNLASNLYWDSSNRLIVSEIHKNYQRSQVQLAQARINLIQEFAPEREPLD